MLPIANDTYLHDLMFVSSIFVFADQFGDSPEDSVINCVPLVPCEGTPDRDIIIGTSASDLIFGFEDDDLIEGGLLPDRIYGGKGDDTIQGGEGSDVIFGEEGDDYIFADSPNSAISILFNNQELDFEDSLAEEFQLQEPVSQIIEQEGLLNILGNETSSLSGTEIVIINGVECLLSEDSVTNQHECEAILGLGSTDPDGNVIAGDFGPSQYDMAFTNISNPNLFFNVDNTDFDFDHGVGVSTTFIPIGATYILSETQIVAADSGGPFPITKTVPPGCEAIAVEKSDPNLNGPQFTASGSALIAGGQAVVCAIQNSECVDGSLAIEKNKVDAACDVDNVIISAAASGSVPIEIGKSIVCVLDDIDPANNQAQCNAILGENSTDIDGVVTQGEFGPIQYNMELTNNNVPPNNVFSVDNTQFVLDGDAGVALALVTPRFNYTLAETFIKTSSGPVPIQIQNVPVSCQVVAEGVSGPDGLFIATGFAPIAGGQAVVCAIQNSECIDGSLAIEKNTTDATCEVDNVIISQETGGGVGIDNNSNSFQSNVDTEQEMHNIGLIVGGDGDDHLFGGSGNDFLKGGKGQDFFDCNEGMDTILDFNPKEDTANNNCEEF